MCLAVPARLIDRTDQATGTVDLHGTRIEVSVALVPEVSVGDWVLVHAGFAIAQLDEAEAEATFAVLEDLRQAEQAAAPSGVAEGGAS